MERTGGNATPSQGGENTAIERATGVECDFAAIVFPAEIREHPGDIFERGIGSGDEENIGCERIGRQAGVRGAAADGAHGCQRSFFRLRDDSADAPAELAEAPRERLPHAPRADDGNSAGHLT
jgi:hypothetical protein